MNTRSVYGFGFLIACAILAGSVYLQVVDGVEPCPLCTLQRIDFGIIGIICLLGALLNPKGCLRFFYNSLLMFLSVLGIVLAGRQVWLQYFQTGSNSECGVSLHYMLQVLPLQEVAQKIFSGSAECSQRGMEFLSLTIAEWALLWFVVFLGLSLYLMLSKRAK